MGGGYARQHLHSNSWDYLIGSLSCSGFEGDAMNLESSGNYDRFELAKVTFVIRTRDFHVIIEHGDHIVETTYSSCCRSK